MYICRMYGADDRTHALYGLPLAFLLLPSSHHLYSKDRVSTQIRDVEVC